MPEDEAKFIWEKGQQHKSLVDRMRYYSRVVLGVEEKLLGTKEEDEAIQVLRNVSIFKYQPVGVKEFICSPDYLNKEKEIYPIVLDEAIELNSGKYVEAILVGGIGCLPPDSEFLTINGWRRMDSWDEQLVAQYDSQTGKISFVKPGYIIKPSTGFWNFQNKRTMSMRLSPEHTMLLTSYKGKRYTTTSQELVNKGVGGNTVPCTFRVDRAGISLSDDEIRLMVAVIADSHISNYVRVDGTCGCRVVLRKERKKNRLVKLLQKCGIAYKKYGPYKKRPTEEGFGFEPPWEVKDYSKFWNCNQLQLQVIYDEMPHWDGLHDFEEEWRFHTVIKKDADFAQYMCHALGHKATIGIRSSESRGGRQTLYIVQATNEIDVERKLEENPDWIQPEGNKYCFSVPTGFFVARDRGSIFITGNSGKTSLALFTNCYQLYLLSCMLSPHSVYKLDPSSEILLIFQSINKQLAKGVDYDRFRSMIEGSLYFRHNFPFDKNITSRLVFPNRIEVVPVSGSETAAIGQNVIGGMIDELNYMSVVEKSKASVDKGLYDQAVAVYNSIARRRKSRFLEDGTMPGILCLVSSKKYPGQFTDTKMEEAKSDPTIYVYDKRVWDIKPSSFTKGWFHVFIGDMTRKPRILKSDEKVSDADRLNVVAIPEEFKVDFEKDIINALREIAGVSTLARHPYFLEVDKVNKAFKYELQSIFSQSPVDFVQTKLTLRKNAFYKPELPRFAHVDLALTGDSAGLAIGTVTGFVNVSGDEERPAYMPVFHIDGTLEILPPRNAEIMFSKIRQVIFVLRKMGLNIRWVSLDQFQSADFQQILRQQGIITGTQSIDEVPSPSGVGKPRGQPYDYCKNAIYEGRVSMPVHPHLQKEILMLEKDTKTGKIDHPPGFSKDVSDSLAGIVYGLTMRKEIWAMYGIPITMIPSNVQEAKDNLNSGKEPNYQENFTEEPETEADAVRTRYHGDKKAYTSLPM